MSSSVLEKDYKDPERPYSQKELKFTRKNNYRVLRLGQVQAHHSKCGHFYLTKYNGRKEKEIKESGSSDTGNCSVCWKFNKTPRHLRNPAKNLIGFYQTNFEQEPPYLTYDVLEGETDFYKWLYEEFI
jgi:hypothetical protein